MQKKILLLLIFACQCSIVGSTNLALNVYQEEYSKHYVEGDQIVLSNEGILIILENMNLVVSGIFRDPSGFYYLEDGVQWICSNCGALNDLDDYTCYRCHESR